MGPLIQSLNHHNSHLEAILGIPEQSWCITWHGVGWPHLKGQLHLSTCVPGETDPRNRPTTTSGAVISGVQGKSRHIPGPAAPGMWPPCAPSTFVDYKSHLRLAGTETQCRSNSISPFCSLRVGFV
jgi:hypothetical protein